MTAQDLRSNWIDITVTGTLPTNATAFEIRGLFDWVSDASRVYTNSDYAL